MHIVGVRGAISAGKDTLGELFAAKLGWRVRKFATPLREVFQLVTDIPASETCTAEQKAAPCPLGEHLQLRLERAVLRLAPLRGSLQPAREMAGILRAAEAAEGTLTVGRVLQLLGTECFRGCLGEDVWVDATERQLRADAADGAEGVIITDARFPNETALVRRLGGTVVRVTRRSAADDAAGAADDAAGDAAAASGRSTAHASERALDGEDPDIDLCNSGTKEELFEAAIAALPQSAHAAHAGTGVPPVKK